VVWDWPWPSNTPNTIVNYGVDIRSKLNVSSCLMSFVFLGGLLLLLTRPSLPHAASARQSSLALLAGEGIRWQRPT